MPELAEVAFACRQWDIGLGKYIKKVHVHPKSRVFRDLSRKQLVRELTGAKLLSSSTHGKQMLFQLSGNRWLGLHLGMTGNLTSDTPSYTCQKHDALVIFQSCKVLVFRDPRQFGRLRLHIGTIPPEWWANLPVSMLDPEFTLSFLLKACERHAKRPMKALLLDQRYFQGMGNWMADEVLWRAGIHPALRAGQMSREQTLKIFNQIKFVARGAMKSVGEHGGDPPRGWLFHVRWKDGGYCPKTKIPLVREEIGGRTSCWCPTLQKLSYD